MSFFLTTLVLSLIASCFYGVTEAGVVLEDTMVFETAVSTSLGTVLLLFIPLVGFVYSLILLFKGPRYPD